MTVPSPSLEATTSGTPSCATTTCAPRSVLGRPLLTSHGPFWSMGVCMKSPRALSDWTLVSPLGSMGSRSGGSGPRVLCHVEPPTSMSSPPVPTQTWMRLELFGP